MGFPLNEPSANVIFIRKIWNGSLLKGLYIKTPPDTLDIWTVLSLDMWLGFSQLERLDDNNSEPLKSIGVAYKT